MGIGTLIRSGRMKGGGLGEAWGEPIIQKKREAATAAARVGTSTAEEAAEEREEEAEQTAEREPRGPRLRDEEAAQRAEEREPEGEPRDVRAALRGVFQLR